MAALLTEMQRRSAVICDQYEFYRVHRNRPSDIHLDLTHEIFTNSAGRVGFEHEDYSVEGERIRNRRTNTTACIFHGAGESHDTMDTFVKQLGYGTTTEPYSARLVSKWREKRHLARIARRLHIEPYLARLLFEPLLKPFR